MTNKEIEQKIQESADKIEMRNFEDIWEEIGPQIAAESRKKPIKWKKWMPIAASFLCITVAGSIALPFILPSVFNKGNNSSSSDEIRYLDTELEMRVVQSADFFKAIQDSNLEVVNLSSFNFLTSYIYHLSNDETKGGYVEAYKEQAGIMHYLILNFYDTSVEYSDPNFSDFDLFYTTKMGLNIDYKHSQEYDVYYAQAEYKNVNYYMQCTSGGGEITEFFEEFFQ